MYLPDVTYSCQHLQNSPKFLQGKIQLTFKECLKHVIYLGTPMMLNKPNPALFPQGPTH